MKSWLSNIWIKIGRMGMKQFSKYQLYIILSLILSDHILGILFIFLMFLICSSGGGGCSDDIAFVIICIVHIFIYLLSNFYLAKRFQDCGICGVRAFVLGIIFLIIAAYLPESMLRHGLNFVPYLIVLIPMCFIKGNPGTNKYGDAV